MSRTEALQSLKDLLRSRRWAALATRDAEGEVFASMVAYVPENPECRHLLLHLSHLAAHTRNLDNGNRVCLAVSEPDDGRPDPQTLARASVEGTVIAVEQDEQGYAEARRRYLEKLPEAEPRFGFSDFSLFRLNVEEIRFVGGFGRAFTFGAGDLG